MYRNHHANFEQNVIMDFRDIYDNRMQRCQEQLGKTRHGHVCGLQFFVKLGLYFF